LTAVSVADSVPVMTDDIIVTLSWLLLTSSAGHNYSSIHANNFFVSRQYICRHYYWKQNILTIRKYKWH